MRLRPFILACLLAALAPAAAQAQSGAVQKAALKVFQDYVTDGRIDPCRHTSQELKLALDNVPPDIEQYAADYPAAIKAALQARARGDCEGKKPATGLIQPPAATPTPAPTPRPTPVPTAVPTKTVVPDPPEPETATVAATSTPVPTRPDAALERVATARPASTAPAPVLLLGLLVLLLAMSALLALGARRFGLADRFPGAAHAWSDLRWRSQGTWEDFRDWLRLGR
ncbi:MAG TPA: hypothetical protein VM266_05015 [Solirubrobacteraceae bacterium]|nr:hypothetical protein [Solirubrobacteraceae bacterium]